MIASVGLLILALAARPAVARTPEVTIAAKSYSGWAGPSWDFDLKGVQGRVRVYDGTREERRIISVPPARLRAFVASVMAESFFNLGTSFGNVCIDCGGCSLVVKVGDRERKITLGEYLDNGSSPADRAAFDRARRVFDSVKALAGIDRVRDACQARAVEQADAADEAGASDRASQLSAVLGGRRGEGALHGDHG